MRKKYLSALLFGALLFASAGTFTSCKDYDDDINNLQTQIDGLTTKEDMEAKLSQMETAINDAKATAEEALKAAQEAGDADEIAKLEERIKALEDAAIDVDALKKEIADSVDSQMADFRDEMEKLLKEVQDLTGYSLDMVTGISFVMGEKGEDYFTGLDVNYARVENILIPGDNYDATKQDAVNKDISGKVFASKTSYKFGEGFTGEFTINAKDVNTVVDEMLVKLDPVNSVITSDMLSLINGKGENLNDYVNITCSSWSDDIVGSRASSATGLYKIGVQLKNDVDFEAFDKMVLPNPGDHNPDGCDETHEYNMFALAVSDAEKSRSVTSEYKVSLHVQTEKEAVGIADNSELSSSASLTGTKIGLKSTAGNNDDNCFPIVLGEDFDLKVAADEDGGKVMASYVIVDINNKDLSTTDKVAINTLKFEGVENVITGDTHVLKVSGSAGVAVPMKLVTIDYTGVVKENVFWVKASTPALMTAKFTMSPAEFVTSPKAWSDEKITASDMQEFKIPAGATHYTLELVAGETYGATVSDDYSEFIVDEPTALTWNEIKDKNSKSVLKLYKSDKKTTATKQSEVAYAAFSGTLNLQAMREDKAYSGIIKFYNGDNYLGSNSITVTKSLPTEMPAGFSAKTNAINNGVMTIYPEPQSQKGIFDLTKAFNGWLTDGHLSLTIDGITNLAPDKVKAKVISSAAQITEIVTDVIGDNNSYESVIKYNYGDIKYIPTGHGVDSDAKHEVTWGTEFATKFGCWPVDCEYFWTGTPVVYYRETNVILGKVTKDGEGNVTAFENVIGVKTPYGAYADPFDSTDEDWTTWAKYFDGSSTTQNVTIELYTTNNGKEVKDEFFTAKFAVVDSNGKEVPAGTSGAKNAMVLTPTSTEVVLSGDVETKVVLKFTDEFNKERSVPALTFTMKKDHK